MFAEIELFYYCLEGVLDKLLAVNRLGCLREDG